MNRKVSIIFVNYNGKKILGQLFYKFLESLNNQSYPYIEIIAVDNSSTDGSTDEIKRILPSARLITLPRNYGYTVAANIGVKIATGDLIIVMNNDIIISKKFIEKIVQKYNELSKKLGNDVVVYPLQIVGNGDKFLGIMTIVNRLWQALPLGYLLEKDKTTKILHNMPKCWQGYFVDGAFFMFSRNAYNKLRRVLFPLVEMYYDDVELGLRLRRVGIPIFTCKDLVIYHKLYSTSKITINTKKHLNYYINSFVVAMANGVALKDLAVKFITDFGTIFAIGYVAKDYLLPFKYIKRLKYALSEAKIIKKYYDNLEFKENLVLSNIIFIPKKICTSSLFVLIRIFLTLISHILKVNFKYYCTNTLI